MKITKSQLKTTMALLKPMEEKDQAISIHVTDGLVHIYSKRDGSFLMLKQIKTEDPDSHKVTIKKDFLAKLFKQDAEEVNIKINEKTLTSKVNGMSFTTSILVEEQEITFPIDNPEGTKITITEDIIKAMNTALSYVSKDSKKAQLLGVNIVLKNKVLSINASDSLKLYVHEFNTDVEGEFSVIIRPETVSLLTATSMAIGSKPYPVLINENNLYIISKGMYYKTVFITGSFPNLNAVFDKVTASPTVMELEIDEESIKKLKAIENESKTLEIEKVGKAINFIVKSEIDKNSFSMQTESDVADFVKKVNYNSLTEVLSILQTVTIKADFLLLKKENVRVILLAMRE